MQSASFIKLLFQNSSLTNCIYKHVNENAFSYGWKYYASHLQHDKKLLSHPTFKALVSEHKRYPEKQTIPNTSMCNTHNMNSHGVCNKPPECFKVF